MCVWHFVRAQSLMPFRERGLQRVTELEDAEEDGVHGLVVRGKDDVGDAVGKHNDKEAGEEEEEVSSAASLRGAS